MSVKAPVKRSSVSSRRAGYVVAVLVNIVMLVGANRWPGWDVVPFLSADTEQVMTAVNLSIAANLAANAIYLVRDPQWLRSAGDVVTLAVGLNAVVRVWQVFPFDLDGSAGWALVVRLLLAVGFVGSCIGMVVALVALFRSAPGR